MKFGHNLKFKDKRDQSFCDAEIKRFVDNFFNKDTFEKIEITKDNIFLYRKNQTGFEHFTLYGFTPQNAKEMLIYITALNNSNFTNKLYK